MASKKTSQGPEPTNFTIKFTEAERDLVGRLVQAREAELHESTGQQISVSIASYLRWLIEKDARERGLFKPEPKRK